MKKLKRNEDKGWIGGVCAGLEDWTDIPAIVWRCLFVFIGGTGLPYLLLWIFLESNEK
tara:strand:- start:2303 stop:2476 length:174 start_codon:yes stop_codon:yes gene_type:complete